MEYLSKVSREDLEEMIRTLMSELEEDNPELYEKYRLEAEDYMYCMSIEEARTIVHNMKPYGEKFSYEAINLFLSEKDLDLDELEIIEYYLVMNMFYNDFKPVFDKYPALNIKETYYEFSKCFIEDVDAPKYKVEKYFNLFN